MAANLKYAFRAFIIVACMSMQSVCAANSGTMQQLYEWTVKTDLTQWSDVGRCLATGFYQETKDKKKYSQFGEDGIIDFIFSCINTTNKYYVEFGTETCQECTSRALREQGWSGLLMDGFHEDAAINLHKEFMRSDNIVKLFQKYNVPTKFDQLTIDIDMNTPWVLHSILVAGYRPRAMTVEYNRNFHSTESYMSLDMPNTVPIGCWFGASGLALERMLKYFKYTLVAFDVKGINLFFVQDDILGGAFPHTFADLTPNYNLEAWKPLHENCQNMLWVKVDDAPGLATARWMRHLHPVVLSHKARDGTSRRFENVQLGAALTLRPCWSTIRRHHRQEHINCISNP